MHLLEKNQEINLHFQPVAMSGPSLFLCAFSKNNVGAPEPLVHPPADPCCHARPTGTNLGFRVSTERYFDTVDSWSRDLNCRLFCSSGRATLVPQQFTTERRRETNSHPPSRGRPQVVALMCKSLYCGRTQIIRLCRTCTKHKGPGIKPTTFLL